MKLGNVITNSVKNLTDLVFTLPSGVYVIPLYYQRNMHTTPDIKVGNVITNPVNNWTDSVFTLPSDIYGIPLYYQRNMHTTSDMKVGNVITNSVNNLTNLVFRLPTLPSTQYAYNHRYVSGQRNNQFSKSNVGFGFYVAQMSDSVFTLLSDVSGTPL
jgi:hypothetical protein